MEFFAAVAAANLLTVGVKPATALEYQSSLRDRQLQPRSRTTRPAVRASLPMPTEG